ncbi:MAG: molybdate ABC transporter permease subunit [Bacteriovoracaceae bacterium]|nr:molybdate ABC transporter permease subunit [Bacteriovoracaceae bacterium]
MDFQLNNDILFSLGLSFKVAGIATCFVIVISIILAYLLARRRFIGKELLDVIFTLPLVLPPTITGYYLVVLFGRNGVIGQYLDHYFGVSLLFDWKAAVIAAVVVSLPLMIKTVRASFEAVNEDLINASYTLGRNEFKTVMTVLIPLSKRGILAGAILAFTRALGEFGATLMVAGNIPGKTNTIPLTIFSLVESGEWERAHGVVLIYTLLAGCFLYASNRLVREKR